MTAIVAVESAASASCGPASVAAPAARPFDLPAADPDVVSAFNMARPFPRKSFSSCSL
jgi:hypothetical protein